MNPEIKAMLPELPFPFYDGFGLPHYKFSDIEAWLDKLTEGAEQKVGFFDDDGFVVCGPGSVASTHTALLICPRKIKKQTPLEIAVEALKRYESVVIPSYNDGIIASRDAIYAAREALAKIEAAK